MAVQVEEPKIGAGIAATPASWHEMVPLQFLIVEEHLTADWAAVAVACGDGAVTGSKGSCCEPGPPRPVAVKLRIIRTGRTTDQNVPLDGDPGKLQDVRSRPLIPEHPTVLSPWLEPSKVSALCPSQ